MLEVGEGGIQAGEDAPPGAQQLRPLRAHPGDRHPRQIGDQTQRVAQAMLLDRPETGAAEVAQSTRKGRARRVTRARIAGIAGDPRVAVPLIFTPRGVDIVASPHPAGSEMGEECVLHVQGSFRLVRVPDFENKGLSIHRRATGVSASGRPAFPAHPQQEVPVPLAREFGGAGFDAVSVMGQRFGFFGAEVGTVHGRKGYRTDSPRVKDSLRSSRRTWPSADGPREKRWSIARQTSEVEMKLAKEHPRCMVRPGKQAPSRTHAKLIGFDARTILSTVQPPRQLPRLDGSEGSACSFIN